MNPGQDINPAQPPGMSSAGPEAAHREKIRVRRNLARSTMGDMARLLSAWQDNSVTTTKSPAGGRVQQPLTVTLDEEQIEAITKEYERLRIVAARVEDAITDWELSHHALTAANLHGSSAKQPPQARA